MQAEAGGMDVTDLGLVPERPLSHPEAVARSRALREKLEANLRRRRN
jgi:hypothetical protein